MYARAHQVQVIVRHVIDGTSVALVGKHWSGRTELLRHVADALRGIGLSLLQLRGIENGPSLEAFRAALPNLSPSRRSEVAVVSEVPRLVNELLSDGPAAVLVDDIDLLDAASWVLLEQVHKATGVPIIATAEARSDMASDARLLIRKAQPVVKLSVDALRLDAIHDLLEERLGDQVAPSLSGRIHMKSGGLPGYAVAFADSATRRGRIRKVGSVWHDGPDLWSEELDGAFESLLYRYSPETRDALEMLAATGPLPLSDATTLVGQSLLEQLDGRGLVRLFSGGGSETRVTLNPPGITDYYRHRPQSIRGFRLRQHITDVLGAGVILDSAEDSTAGRHLAEVIPQPEVPLLARALRDAFSTDLARTWSQWNRSRSLVDATEAIVLRLTGESPSGQVEEILAKTTTEGAGASELLYFRYLEARWLITRGRSLRDAERVLRGTDDLGHPEAIEALLIGFRAEQSEITPAALARITEIADLPGLTGGIGSLIHIVLHALGGYPEVALARIEGLNYAGWAPRSVAALRGLALITAGRPREALEWASAQLVVAREFSDRSAMVAEAYIAVTALILMSRYSDATAAGSIVASGQFQAGNLLFGPDRALMNGLALAAGRSGRPGSVGALIELGASYHGRSDALPFGADSFPAAILTELGSESVVAGRRYRELGLSLRGRGYEFTAAGAMVLAELLDFDFDSAVAERDRLVRAGSSIFVAYIDARIANHRRDAQSLTIAADWLLHEHASGLALRHYTEAARIYREDGEEHLASSVREKIAALMAEEDSATGVAAIQLETSLGFTQREREIIDLVAEGKQNPEIAEALSLSVRTIETHLRNIRRKSGALGRDEIGEYSSLR